MSILMLLCYLGEQLIKLAKRLINPQPILNKEAVQCNA
jgi:hypothetical protein